ncbi:MAG: hypothetical protein RL223_4919 [Pseudomonadota bacterium]
MPAKISRPMTSSWPRGQANWACAASSGSGSGSGWVSSMPRAAHSTVAAISRPTPASCVCGDTSSRSRPAASAAPPIAPRLNMPCRPLMIVVPPSASSAEPSALIATS